MSDEEGHGHSDGDDGGASAGASHEDAHDSGGAAAAEPNVAALTAVEAWAAGLSFSRLCDMLEQLRTIGRDGIANKQARRAALLFPVSVRARVAAGDSLYPYIRLVIPNTDTKTR